MQCILLSHLFRVASQIANHFPNQSRCEPGLRGFGYHRVCHGHSPQYVLCVIFCGLFDARFKAWARHITWVGSVPLEYKYKIYGILMSCLLVLRVCVLCALRVAIQTRWGQFSRGYQRCLRSSPSTGSVVPGWWSERETWTFCPCLKRQSALCWRSDIHIETTKICISKLCIVCKRLFIYYLQCHKSRKYKHPICHDVR